MMKIQEVPPEFRRPDPYHYPTGNFPDFEYWFSSNLQGLDYFTNRVYLPVLWTSFFKRHQYGKDKHAVEYLQWFIDTLPTDQKYFTVVQYDDGTMVDWKGKDVKVFAMSGKPEKCIPIPLVCQPHSCKFDLPRDITFSFVGRVTDVSRKTILEWGRGREDCYVSAEPHSIEEYCRILARSEYVLCPRGYGASSFRIAEAYQYGALPIIFKRSGDRVYSCPLSSMYSYDLLNEFGLDSLLNLPKISPFERGITVQKGRKLYSFEGVKDIILHALWDLT